MHKIIASALLFAFLLMPSGALAATKKPTISIVSPGKNASVDRTEKMPINWALKDVTRNMVIVTNVKLVKEDTKHPSVGFSSGGARQDVVYAGQTTASYTYDWGLNSTIPGKYSITSELRECNPAGCHLTAGTKRISKKASTAQVTVRNDSGVTSEVTTTGTTVEVLSPDGGEKYVAGSGKKLSIKWNATGVPKGSTVCTVLEKRGAAGGMYAFPVEKSCKKAKNGKDSVTGKLIRTGGYDLGPGDYWARVTIGAKATGGKDGATLAQDISDSYFTLK